MNTLVDINTISKLLIHALVNVTYMLVHAYECIK